MTNKPFSQSCENNKAPILEIIRRVFTQPCHVWEIGSGTGQHACYFAKHLPYLQWHPTDRAENISGINLWQQESNLPNLHPALILNVTDSLWPCNTIEALFTANTLHIMSEEEVQIMFMQLGNYLSAQAKLCIYGPFNYHGAYSSQSNAQFDIWLKHQNQLSGIRHFETIVALALESHIHLIEDVEMPANNRLLVFQKA